MFVKCAVLAWAVLGVVGCGEPKNPSSEKTSPGPADSTSGLTTPGGAKGTKPPGASAACEAAGGKCISPAAAVVCKSQPAAGCDVGMICCVM